jgi:phage terminase large subunit
MLTITSPPLISQPSPPATSMNFRESILRRLIWSLKCSKSQPLRMIEREKSRRDIFYWLDTWVWTSDPRLSEKGLLANVPFDLFASQRELVTFLMDRLAAKQDHAIAKSRDMGFSWIAAAVAVWHWLYVPGFKTTYSSYEQSKVDHLGNPDSFFEKCRILLRLLPTWMLPPGYTPSRHDNFMRLVNPENGNVISGEVGDQMGRGGRSSWYLLDECAFMDHPDAVDAATAANTRCRTFGSTVSGLGNLFARKWFSLAEAQKFRLHWSSDPRKTTLDPGWEARERGRLEGWKFASEYDIDFSASVEGVFIPAAWVQSCVRLAEFASYETVPPSTHGVAGMDVGGGGDGLSTYVSRFGPWVRTVVSRGDPDTIGTAHWGVECARADSFTRPDGWDCSVTRLHYDEIGIGTAVRSTFLRHEVIGLNTTGVNVGKPPSETQWEDGESSEEKFGNMKAELWAMVRERVKCGHELYLHLTGQPGGVEHPWANVLILPNKTKDDMTLQEQMSYPRRLTDEKGRVIVEKKKDMLEKRGLKSPDHAEALVLTVAQPDLDVWEKLGAAA